MCFRCGDDFLSRHQTNVTMLGHERSDDVLIPENTTRLKSGREQFFPDDTKTVVIIKSACG